MFLALLIAAAVFITIAIVMKNWIFGAIAVVCVIGALLLGHGHSIGMRRAPAVRFCYQVRHAYKPMKPGAVCAIIYRETQPSI